MPIDIAADIVGAGQNESEEFIPVVMTAAEVAAMLRVSPVTVYKWKDADGLPYRKFVGAVRFYRHEVLQWMQDQSNK